MIAVREATSADVPQCGRVRLMEVDGEPASYTDIGRMVIAQPLAAPVHEG